MQTQVISTAINIIQLEISILKPKLLVTVKASIAGGVVDYTIAVSHNAMQYKYTLYTIQIYGSMSEENKLEAILDICCTLQVGEALGGRKWQDAGFTI